MSAQMSDTMDPSVQKWLDEFAQKPLDALARLLYGKVWLSGYESGEVAQALPQFLPVARHEALDGCLCEWLAKQLKSSELPESVSAKGYARALVNAFGLLQAIDLPRSRGWCTENVARLSSWLKSQAAYPSRDPRPGFLRALALSQVSSASCGTSTKNRRRPRRPSRSRTTQLTGKCRSAWRTSSVWWRAPSRDWSGRT